MTSQRAPDILLLLLFLLLSFSTASSTDMADADSASSSTLPCLPEVRIQTFPTPWSLCLNTISQGTDSCVRVSIDGSKLFGGALHFYRSRNGTWRYTGMHVPDDIHNPPDIHLEQFNNPEGNLERMIIYPNSVNNSYHLSPYIAIDNDRPVNPDTIPKVNITISRTVFSCPKIIVEKREYTYPPDYRRDPVYNRPELSMFHYGMSVRMPTSYSLDHRAMLFLYWHCEVLAELKFDDPQEIIRKEAANNHLSRRRSKPPSPKKKSFFSLRPLR